MENISPPLQLDFCSHDSISTKPSSIDAAKPRQVIQSEDRISIISNSCLLREALVLLLQAHQAFRFFLYYASDASNVVDFVHSEKHLILLDSSIGRDLTTTWIQQLRSLKPSPFILVLELKHDTDLILDCIEAGAHAYALQGASSTDIIQIIEQVYKGVFQYPLEVTTKLLERLVKAKSAPQPKEKSPLTRRELEVLQYVAKSYSDREIAAQLVVEVRTVKHHVHNILHKLKVRNRWDAAQLALKNCWLDLVAS